MQATSSGISSGTGYTFEAGMTRKSAKQPGRGRACKKRKASKQRILSKEAIARLVQGDNDPDAFVVASASARAIEKKIKKTHDPALINDWHALSTSDHFYYMCTKYYADAAVHAYFNPYESPYDAYINFMNVLDNLRSRVEAKATA